MEQTRVNWKCNVCKLYGCSSSSPGTAHRRTDVLKHFVLSSCSFAGAACSKGRCGVRRPQTISALAKNQDVRSGCAKSSAITSTALPAFHRNPATLILKKLNGRRQNCFSSIRKSLALLDGRVFGKERKADGQPRQAIYATRRCSFE